MFISFFFLCSFSNYKQTLLATSSHTQPLGPPLRLNDLSTMTFSHMSKNVQFFNHIFFKSSISIKVITLITLSHSLKSYTHLKRSEVIRIEKREWSMSDQKKTNQGNGGGQSAPKTFANLPKSRSEVRTKIITEIFKRSASVPANSSSGNK